MEQLKATIDFYIQFLKYPLFGGWLSILTVIVGFLILWAAAEVWKYFWEKLGY